MFKCGNYTIHCEISDIVDQLILEGLLANKTSEKSNYIMVCCPFHNEKRPSSSITTEEVVKGDKVVPKGYFHCFGCGSKSNIFEFVSRCLGKSDLGISGLKWIQAHWKTEEYGGTHINITSSFKKSVNKSRSRSRRGQKPAYWITEEVLDTYRYSHPYMYERRLTDDYIEFFDIGYDCNTESITFPVKDLQGYVGYISRRSVHSRFHIQEEAGIKTNFVWGAYECIQDLKEYPQQEVYICESILNAIRYWQVGKLAVALLGTGGGNQYKILSQIPAKYFVCSLDCDDAGRKGTTRILTNEYLRGYNIKSIEYPSWVEEEKKDINDLTDEEILNLTYKWYLGDMTVGGTYIQSSNFE